MSLCRRHPHFAIRFLLNLLFSFKFQINGERDEDNVSRSFYAHPLFLALVSFVVILSHYIQKFK